jgi:hypothetical protein
MKLTLNETINYIIPEGWHVFYITDVKTNEDFGKAEVYMKTKDDLRHAERFHFMKNDGSKNDGAIAAFSFFARTAFNDPELQDVEVEDLKGHYIRCLVKHERVSNKFADGVDQIYIRLVSKKVATKFEDDPAPAPASKPAPASSATAPSTDDFIDLRNFLND